MLFLSPKAVIGVIARSFVQIEWMIFDFGILVVRWVSDKFCKL